MTVPESRAQNNELALILQDLQERVNELEKQVEALRRPLKNYQEKKGFASLWGRRK